MDKNIKYAFFGTPDRAVFALDELKSAGLMPALIVTQPDRPQGRKLVLTPPPAKIWAEREGVPVLQPDDLADPAFLKAMRDAAFDAFVVVAYGKILRQEVLDMPKCGCLNLHGSLLPLLRGSSPIETAILEDRRETGVTVILMDKLMDHGPIVAQKKVVPTVWPLPADDLAKILVSEGGKLLADALPKLVRGEIAPREQDHSKATLTKKISKEDGLIDPSSDPYQNFLKWNAYKGWPGSYFFVDKNGKRTRVVITDAAFEDGRFIIKKVVPEGRKEMPWADFNTSS